MDQIVKFLLEAAAEGNIQMLLNLLEKDRYILDRCMVISYGETPLHIAALLGHLDFCKELLRRKPQLAEELDSRKSSALHLASGRGFTEIVKLLVSVCPKMGFSFDEDGKIPLHVAAMKGRVGVLKELVDIQPDAAHTRVEMCKRETVLHLCVQYSRLEALRFLVENLSDEELVNAKDDNGNTILHLAVFDKQVQIVNYLVQNSKIDAYAVNLSGLTSLDILSHTRRDSKYIDISHCLHNYASRSSKIIPLSSQVVEPEIEAKCPRRRYQRLPISKDKKKASTLKKSGSLLKKHTTWLENQRNTLMVVASLIATMGFQAALTPPGRFTQEVPSGNNPDYYKEFFISNTVGSISSLTVIVLLLSGIPYPRKVFMWILMVIMWIALSAMAFTYFMSICETSNGSMDPYNNSKIAPFIVVGWLMLMALLIMMHTIRLFFYLTRSWNSKLRVFIWILMGIVFILVASMLSYITVRVVHGDLYNNVDGDLSDVPKTLYVQYMILIIVVQGWVVLWMVFGLTVLVRIIVITTKKLIRSVVILAGTVTTVCIIVKKLIRRIGVIMTSLKSLDNIVVV